MTRLAPALLILGFAAFSFWQTADARMADLLATWLAGHFYDLGALDQIYAADRSVFTMQPPSDWEPLMRARGYEDAVFPFIYPPLWAWAAAPLAARFEPESFFAVARLVNPLLMGVMVWLAARATRTRLSPVLFVAIGLFVLGFSNIGQVALADGQPQILVSFLTVLAIERLSRGSPRAAGIVMALAAAIKLYPAVYALAWAVAKRWRALVGFVIAGGALGLCSIAVAGWPLHAAFLDQVRAIGSTVLLTKINFSLDPVLGQILFADRFVFIAGDSEVTGWFVAQKGPVWSALSLAGLALSVGLCAKLFQRTHDPLVWPLLMILASLLTPLSWVYHYLAPVAFAPALLDRLGSRIGGLWLMACFFPLLLPSMAAIDSIFSNPLVLQIISILCLGGLAAGFGLAIVQKPHIE